MKTDEIYIELFSYSRPTYYKWKRENNKALKLIQKYFTDKEIIEFIKTGEVSAQELNPSQDSIMNEHLIFHIVKRISTGPTDFEHNYKKELVYFGQERDDRRYFTL